MKEGRRERISNKNKRLKILYFANTESVWAIRMEALEPTMSG